MNFTNIDAAPDMVIVGQIFDSLHQFKEVLRLIAVDQGWVTRVNDTDALRVRMGCRSAVNCPWSARCVYKEDIGKAVVTRLNDVHTCLGAPAVNRREVSRVKFLVRILPRFIPHITTRTETSQIIDIVRTVYGVTLNPRQAQLAKQALLNVESQQIAAAFELLPAYKQRLRETNPPYHRDPLPFANEDSTVHEGGGIEGYEATEHNGVYTDLCRDDDNRFQRLFICPQIAQNFVCKALSIITLDGTFVKTGYKQTLLTAVGRDGNNQRNWPDLPNNPNPRSQLHTVLSDRDKGLAAADYRLNHCNRGHCCYHISDNIRKKYGGAEAAKLFLGLARAKHQHQYETVMGLIRNASPAAEEYINNIPRERWCAMDFPGPRFGQITSNASEIIINILLNYRSLNVIEMLDGIWNYVMTTRFPRFKASYENFTTQFGFLPHNDKVLTKYAQGPHSMGSHLYAVNGTGTSY